MYVKSVISCHSSRIGRDIKYYGPYFTNEPYFNARNHDTLDLSLSGVIS